MAQRCSSTAIVCLQKAPLESASCPQPRECVWLSILLLITCSVGEVASHSLLARKRLAPELLARFNNGLLYRYIEGTPCTPEDLRKPDIFVATARRMGEWHGVLPVAEAIANVDPNEWQAPAHTLRRESKLMMQKGI